MSTIEVQLTPTHLRGVLCAAVPAPAGATFWRVIREALLEQEARLDPARPPAPPPAATVAFVCECASDDLFERVYLVVRGAEVYLRVDAVAQALGVMPADLVRTWLDQAFAPPPPRTCVDPDDFADEPDFPDDPF